MQHYKMLFPHQRNIRIYAIKMIKKHNNHILKTLEVIMAMIKTEIDLNAKQIK